MHTEVRCFFFKKLVEGKPISIGNIAYVLETDAKRLDRWYKDYLSGFREAERDGRIGKDDIVVHREGGRKKIRVPILKESNVGSYMAIDEKTIDGVCYTIISNRETSKIALMADTLRTSELRQVLSKFPVKTKMKVLSVTRDWLQITTGWRGRPFPMPIRWRTSFTSSAKSLNSSRVSESATGKRSLPWRERRIRR